MDTEVLAICPWCAVDDGLSLVYFGQPAKAWAVTCLICGCEGPRREAMDEAAKAWNTRLSPITGGSEG